MEGETNKQKIIVPPEKILNAYKAGPEAVISLISYLTELIENLSRQNEALRQQIKQLEAKQHSDSHNSSKPPSSDGLTKRPYPERKPTGKKPGGQKGHEGRTLEMVKDPTIIRIHEVHTCEVCGKSLKKQAPRDYDRRQVFDIPPIAVEATEHRAEIKDCSRCGHTNVGHFPEEVTQKVQYGDRLKSYGVYFKSYTLIPYERTAELFEDLFGVPLSEGTLVNIVNKCAEKLEGVVQLIKEKLTQAAVAHFDETGISINGKLHWLHEAGTEGLTYYFPHAKRGSEAMDEIGILGAFQGTAVHDHWGAYWKYDCLHALCNAHHLRELAFVWEEYEQDWAEKVIDLLLEAKETVEKAKAQGRKRLKEEVIEGFQQRYMKLIAKGMRANPPPSPDVENRRGRQKKSKTRNLVERLNKRSAETLRFVTDFRVPFDNNLGERDIRMMKVQQKISGTFRSIQGAVAFCRIRSYISTVRKQGLNVIDSISSAFEGHTLLLSCLENT